MKMEKVYHATASFLIVLSLLLTVTIVWGTEVGCSGRPIVDHSSMPIGGISENPSDFEGKLVTVAGEYRGWQAENGYGPPVTRSDWVIKDDTGWIYVTGESPQLDPVEDIGTPVEVKGVVGVTGEGIPYIEAGSVNVKK